FFGGDWCEGLQAVRPPFHSYNRTVRLVSGALPPNSNSPNAIETYSISTEPGFEAKLSRDFLSAGRPKTLRARPLKFLGNDADNREWDGLWVGDRLPITQPGTQMGDQCLKAVTLGNSCSKDLGGRTASR